ncbi:MAG: PEP-CTERM sorting domain-containing protein [Planctomycetota bacterium]
MSMTSRHSAALPVLTAAALLGLTAAPAAHATFTTFSAAGSNPAAIQSSVDDFRNELGDLNPFTPQAFADGRRQINWDAAPAAISSPNPFPGDFFNFGASPRARGIEFSTPGTGFALSGDADDGTAIRFADINPTYEDEFQAFSEERLFTPRGSNITRVDFFTPADQTTPATTDGFGAVFVDVDLADTTKLEYYGLGSQLLYTQYVEAADEGLSFAGVAFDSSVLSYVVITTGNFDIGPTDGAFGYDVVVMDDFIFGEPVPEPATAALLGLGALAMLRRRHA